MGGDVDGEPMWLRTPRIKLGAKQIHKSPNFKDYTGKAALQPYAGDILLIKQHLTLGIELPPRFYRKGIDDSPDDLLDQMGVKHLHLGGQNSDVLLFLVEYDHYVVLLEINDHKHFNQLPIGKILQSLHGFGLKKTESEVAPLVNAEAERAARVAERKRRFGANFGKKSPP